MLLRKHFTGPLWPGKPSWTNDEITLSWWIVFSIASDTEILFTLSRECWKTVRFYTTCTSELLPNLRWLNARPTQWVDIALSICPLHEVGRESRNLSIHFSHWDFSHAVVPNKQQPPQSLSLLRTFPEWHLWAEGDNSDFTPPAPPAHPNDQEAGRVPSLSLCLPSGMISPQNGPRSP